MKRFFLAVVLSLFIVNIMDAQSKKVIEVESKIQELIEWCKSEKLYQNINSKSKNGIYAIFAYWYRKPYKSEQKKFGISQKHFEKWKESYGDKYMISDVYFTYDDLSGLIIIPKEEYEKQVGIQKLQCSAVTDSDKIRHLQYFPHFIDNFSSIDENWSFYKYSKGKKKTWESEKKKNNGWIDPDKGKLIIYNPNSFFVYSKYEIPQLLSEDFYFETQVTGFNGETYISLGDYFVRIRKPERGLMNKHGGIFAGHSKNRRYCLFGNLTDKGELLKEYPELKIMRNSTSTIGIERKNSKLFFYLDQYKIKELDYIEKPINEITISVKDCGYKNTSEISYMKVVTSSGDLKELTKFEGELLLANTFSDVKELKEKYPEKQENKALQYRLWQIVKDKNSAKKYRDYYKNELSLYKSRCSINEYYDGVILNGKAEGFGKAINADGLYIGNFKDGLPHGKGKFFYFNKEEYNGISYGMKVYAGYFFKGNREGEGRCVYGYQSMDYTGFMLSQLFNSNTSYFYTGGWKNDVYHGTGLLKVKKGQMLGIDQTSTTKYLFEEGKAIRNLTQEENERIAREYDASEILTDQARKNYSNDDWEEISPDIIGAIFFDQSSPGKRKKITIECAEYDQRDTYIYWSNESSRYYVSSSLFSNQYFNDYDRALQYALDRLDCH